MIISFKGACYKEDCGIYVSKALEEFSKTARLQREGVVLDIDPDRVEHFREVLQAELGHLVKVFTPHDENTVLVDSFCDLHGNFAACGRDGIMKCAYCGKEC